MFPRFLLVMSSMLFLSHSVFAEQQSDPNLFLAMAIQKSDALVKTAMGHFTSKAYKDSTLVEDARCFFAYDGKRFRYDFKYLQVNREFSYNPELAGVTYAFDGGTFKSFEYNFDGSPGYSSEGPISGKSFWNFYSYNPYYSYWRNPLTGMTFDGFPLAEILLQRKWFGQPVDSLEIAGTEKVGDDICYLLKFDSKYSIVGRLGRHKLWLNTRKNYQISKIESEYLGAERVITSVNFQPRPNGIWIPKRIDILQFPRGETPLHRILELESDFQVNIDIPDTIFTRDFPGRKKEY